MRKLILLTGAGAALAGCWAATPRVEDAHAPRDFFAQVRPEPSTCTRVIEWIPESHAPSRPYHEVATISSTCSPGALGLCERRLKERACELGADAVLENARQAGALPPGTSNQALTSVSGRAVRWEPQ